MSVQPDEDFRLHVVFVDGTAGDVYLRAFIESPSIKGTLFESLRDPGYFRQVRIELGAVLWPNGADLAPDAMYDAVRANGHPVGLARGGAKRRAGCARKWAPEVLRPPAPCRLGEVRIEILEQPIALVAEHAIIPISFRVQSILQFEETEGGLTVSETTLPAAYWKDYDALESPLSWPQKFNVANWGLLAALVDERRVGGAVVAFDTAGMEMLGNRRDVAALWDIRIEPQLRRVGIGRALFRAAEDWAASRGCTELRVETQNTNVPACRFYESLGCDLIEINPHIYPLMPEEIQLIWAKAPRRL